MTSIQNGQTFASPMFAGKDKDNTQNEQLAASFQQQIDALKAQLELSEGESSFDDSLSSAASEIQSLIASLESQKAALSTTIDNKTSMSIQQMLGDLSTLNQKLASYNQDYFSLALQATSTKTEETDSSKDKVNALLNKGLIGTGYPIPKNAAEYHNPLEVTDSTQPVANNAIRFTDEHSGKNIELKLASDNMQKLIDKFGSLDSATDYVRNWYYEAAYGVGYLQFDTDASGKISKDEAKALKALVALNAEPPNNYRSLNDTAMSEADKDRFLEEFGFIDSLEEFINHSIRQDTDMNGTLEFKELTGKNSEQVAQKVIELDESGEDSALDIFAFNRLIRGMLNIGGVDNTDLLLSLFGGAETNENRTANTTNNEAVAEESFTTQNTQGITDSKPAASNMQRGSAKITA